MRFVVTELEGYSKMRSGSRGSRYRSPGCSVHVLDTLVNHRVMRTWRSEDYRDVRNVSPRVNVRVRAESYARALNEGRVPPSVAVYMKDRRLVVSEHAAL